MTPEACSCSAGRTQQWPTELTGRCYTHWLSIHRSSPRAPCGERNIPGSLESRGAALGVSLQVTAPPLEHAQLFHMELLLHPASTSGSTSPPVLLPKWTKTYAEITPPDPCCGRD